MEKKHILIALAAIMLVVGSVLTVRAVRERSLSPYFNANYEALLQTEAPNTCYLQTAGGGFNGYVVFCYTKMGQPVQCMGPNYGHFSYTTHTCSW